jgi:two-component sensor histidine kinase/HAMP domain-containing protein
MMNKIQLPQSLHVRILLFSGMLFLVLTLLIVASILMFVFSTEQAAWRARQGEAAENAAANVAKYLRQNETLLFWLDRYEYDNFNKNPIVLQEILSDNPVFMEIIFIDANGNPVLDAARDQANMANQFTILQSEWFLTAKSGQKSYSRVQTSAQNESYTIFAMPSVHGGVLAAQIQMDALWETVAKIHFGKAGSIYIVNMKGQVIAHPDPQVVLSNQNIKDTTLFKTILQTPGQKWIGSTVNFNGVSVVCVSTPVEQTDWIVISELPQDEAYATSRQASMLIPLAISFLMSLTAFLFSELLNRLIIQPLELLRAGANQIGQGQLSHRITIPRPDELGEIMAVFNTMAADLEEKHAALRRYTTELEQRVRERTADLTRTNSDLLDEVHERKAAEEQVRASLNEKEILLKEIHHRVKNNLQIISSLLNLQVGKVTDPQTIQVLHESQSRVRSMALIHEKLYQSDSLARIDFGEYVKSLTTDLFRSYQRGLGRVQLKIEVDEVALELDQAVPCGLILNELMTNALKYAFPDRRIGTLHVELSARPEHMLCLRVADDGAGMPPEFDSTTSKSLGLQLVQSLVAQLDGHLKVDNTSGTAFEVTFGYDGLRNIETQGESR